MEDCTVNVQFRNAATGANVGPVINIGVPPAVGDIVDILTVPTRVVVIERSYEIAAGPTVTLIVACRVVP